MSLPIFLSVCKNKRLLHKNVDILMKARTLITRCPSSFPPNPVLKHNLNVNPIQIPTVIMNKKHFPNKTGNRRLLEVQKLKCELEKLIQALAGLKITSDSPRKLHASQQLVPPVQSRLSQTKSNLIGLHLPAHNVELFYRSLAKKFDNVSLIANPIFVVLNSKGTSTWQCTYHLKWPKDLMFLSSAFRKRESRDKAAVQIINYLKSENRIQLIGDKIVLNDNIEYITTQQEQHTSTVAVRKDTHLTNLQHGILNLTPVHTFLNYNPVRKYSSDVKNNPEPEPEKADIPKIDDELISQTELKNMLKLYPAPKNVLHNVFAEIAQQFNSKTYILKPKYNLRHPRKGVTHWECTYHLKWPEDIKFIETSQTKQDASSKAALLALHYLKKSGKLGKDKHPAIVDEKLQQENKILESFILKPKANVGINNIIATCEKKLAPLLVQTIDDNEDEGNERGIIGNIESPWPEVNVKRKVKMRGLAHYITKEPTKLPISDFKEEIIKTIKDNQVTIIKGEPGCGKSTRVPQYVLEGWATEALKSSNNCSIVVTQPRRIAAVSLAERVASERNELVGNTVGFKVRLNSKFNANTGHILYCTTGILLRKIQSDPKLLDCSHIILDEAHERDVNTDLLMNLLKHAIKLNPNLKLLVMSATIDAEFFQNYFDEAAVVHIPGFTYPVKEHFLDHSKMLDKTMENCENNNPTVVPDDVVKLIKYIHTKKPEGAILVFLPGWDDIIKVRNLLPRDSTEMSVLCLHSLMQDREQRLIFQRPPPGIRKIILATNIAETSVTIDDVVYVIDSGIHKEKRFDVEKGIEILDNHWISKASMAQRKGRAGRVKSGESFHMYPKSKFSEFKDYSTPEILRTSLTKIVLDSKVYSNNEVATEFLGKLLSPPENSAVLRAVDELKDLELLDSCEDLTPLGRVLSDFQLEPKLAKAMVNAVIYNCVTPIVDIVTLFSAEIELFASALIDKEHINKCKRDFSKNSDHLSLMRIFEKWLEFVENSDNHMAARFCQENNLTEHKLSTINKLRDIHFGYLEKGLMNVLPIADDFSDNDELVKGVLLSGVGQVLQHRNYDIVKGRMKKSHVLLTRNNHKATITSESVNFKRGIYPSNYLVYINETRSNVRRITVVRETSLISSLAVLLFKNNKIIIQDLPKEKYQSDIKSSDQVVMKLENTKIEFICDRKEAELIRRCKDSLNSAHRYFIFQLTKGGELNTEANEVWREVLGSLSEVLSAHEPSR